MSEQFAGVILFCSVCCTNVDVEMDPAQEVQTVTVVCNNCETKFTVEVDRAKVAEFASYG